MILDPLINDSKIPCAQFVSLCNLQSELCHLAGLDIDIDDNTGAGVYPLYLCLQY